jgi:heme-degrading monooxygenase HmoA
MYARSITINGDPGAIEAGVTYIRDEVMPAVTAMEGCLGLSLLVDRETGQCIVTSSWQTEDEMRASELQLGSMRARGGEILGGTPRADMWEVAVMHRTRTTGEGACCRVTWLRLNHGDFDRGIKLFRTALLPEIESLEGFCSTSLLVSRETGRACSTTTFESREAMEASRDRAWAIRDSGARDAGVDVMDVSECDLVLAHLRLPELV